MFLPCTRTLSLCLVTSCFIFRNHCQTSFDWLGTGGSLHLPLACLTKVTIFALLLTLINLGELGLYRHTCFHRCCGLFCDLLPANARIIVASSELPINEITNLCNIFAFISYMGVWDILICLESNTLMELSRYIDFVCSFLHTN